MEWYSLIGPVVLTYKTSRRFVRAFKESWDRRRPTNPQTFSEAFRNAFAVDTIKELYQRYYAWKYRPPTPAETAQSKVQLQLSQHLYQQALDIKNYNLALSTLAQATLALNKARRLDPNTKIIVEHKEGPYEVTQDWMSYHYLCLEGLLTSKQGHAVIDVPFKMMSKSDRREWWREALRYYKKSIRAYKKAHKYNPQSPEPFIGLFDAYYAIEEDHKRKARRSIKKALALDRTNMEALSRLQKVNTGWRSLFTRY